MGKTVGTRNRLDRYKHIELHFDPVTKQYIVMPHRYSIDRWEYYDEDEKEEAYDRFNELENEEREKERQISKTVY